MDTLFSQALDVRVDYEQAEDEVHDLIAQTASAASH